MQQSFKSIIVQYVHSNEYLLKLLAIGVGTREIRAQLVALGLERQRSAIDHTTHV